MLSEPRSTERVLNIYTYFDSSSRYVLEESKYVHYMCYWKIVSMLLLEVSCLGPWALGPAFGAPGILFWGTQGTHVFYSTTTLLNSSQLILKLLLHEPSEL